MKFLRDLSIAIAFWAVALSTGLAAYAYYESVGDQISWRKAVVEADMSRCKVKR